MAETTISYVWLLKNWATHENRFIDCDQIGEYLRTHLDWNQDPNVKLYLFEATLEVPHPGGKPQPEVHMRLVREEDETRRPLEAGETELDYVSVNTMSAIHNSLPPGAFGPKIGPLCTRIDRKGPDRIEISMSTPTTGYRVTIETTPPWSFGYAPPEQKVSNG